MFVTVLLWPSSSTHHVTHTLVDNILTVPELLLFFLYCLFLINKMRIIACVEDLRISKMQKEGLVVWYAVAFACHLDIHYNIFIFWIIIWNTYSHTAICEFKHILSICVFITLFIHQFYKGTFLLSLFYKMKQDCRGGLCSLSSQDKTRDAGLACRPIQWVYFLHTGCRHHEHMATRHTADWRSHVWYIFDELVTSLSDNLTQNLSQGAAVRPQAACTRTRWELYRISRTDFRQRGVRGYAAYTSVANCFVHPPFSLLASLLLSPWPTDKEKHC